MADVIVADAVDILAIREHALERALCKMSFAHSRNSNREDHNNLCLLALLSLRDLLLNVVFLLELS